MIYRKNNSSFVRISALVSRVPETSMHIYIYRQFDNRNITAVSFMKLPIYIHIFYFITGI